jgi:hypothetical protein
MTTASPALALDTASAVDLLELALNAVNTMHQSPTIDLELRLTRPAGANATGLLRE